MASTEPTSTQTLPRGVWVLGLVSLLMDIASEMIHSLLPLFLVGSLGLLAAMVADTAPPALRGTAFGFFHLCSGITMLISSAVAGLLWHRLGSSFTFYAGAAFAALTLLLMVLRPPPLRLPLQP